MWRATAVLAALLVATPVSARLAATTAEVLEVGNSAAQLSGRLAKQGSASLAAALKQLLAAEAALTSETIAGKVAVFKQALDSDYTRTDKIPFIGGPLDLGRRVLKTLVVLINNILQSGIHAGLSLKNATIDTLDRVLQANADAFMNASNTSAIAAAQGAQSAVALVETALNKSVAALEAASDALVRQEQSDSQTPSKPYSDLFEQQS